MGEFCDDPMRRAAAVVTAWKLRLICFRKTYADRITIINSKADQSMDQNHDSMQKEWLVDETELT